MFMIAALEALGDGVVGLATDGARQIARVDATLLVAGLVLRMLAEAIRNRGWLTILRAAYPKSALRWRDVVVAYFAGAGLGAVIPMRGNDLIKLALVRRKVEDAHYGGLAATLVPETLF